MKKLADHPFLAWIFPALLAAGILGFRLGSLPFIGPDEPRYARIAEEMHVSGHWVTPRLEGRPWLEKPPLYYWIAQPFYFFMGTGELPARAGILLATLAAAYALFWLGTQIASRLAGLLSAAIFLSSLGIVAFGRSASTDIPLTACLTLSLALLGHACLDGPRNALQVPAGWIFMGLAALAKGPVAFILPAGIGLLFWLLNESGRRRNRWTILGWGFLALAASLPWFWLAFRENGFGLITIFFINHNLSRFVSDIHHHTEPFYYYLPVALGLLFPWTAWLLLLMPGSLRRLAREWRDWDRNTLFLSCWAFFPFLFFSASRSKLPGYILPSLAPVALLLGREFAARMEKPVGNAGISLAAKVHLGLSLLLAAALPFVLYSNYGGAWKEALPVSAACSVTGWISFRAARRGNADAAFRSVVAQSLLVVTALALFCFPLVGRYNSSREISELLGSVRQPGETLISYGYFHHTLHYYTGYTVSADLNEPHTLGEFAAGQRNFLVVTQASRMGELKLLEGFRPTLLGEQGKLRLFRVSRLQP